MEPRAVGQVQLLLLESGAVQMRANLPGGSVALLGVLSAAQAMAAHQMLNPRQGPQVEAAPPGFTVPRVG